MKNMSMYCNDQCKADWPADWLPIGGKNFNVAIISQLGHYKYETCQTLHDGT